MPSSLFSVPLPQQAATPSPDTLTSRYLAFPPCCCRSQVSIVQPISGVGLVGLAVYSHLFLKERLHGVEWGAVALAFVGTVGLGASSSDTGSSSSGGAGEAGAAGAAAGGAAAAAAAAANAKTAAAAAAAGGDAAAAAVADAAAAAAVEAAAVSGGGAAAAGSSEPGALRMLGVLILLAAAVLAVSVARNRRSHRQRRPGDRPAAAAYGLQAGACFGLSAASCRIGAHLREGAAGGIGGQAGKPSSKLRLTYAPPQMVSSAGANALPHPPSSSSSSCRLSAGPAPDAALGGGWAGGQRGAEQQRLCAANVWLQGGQRRWVRALAGGCSYMVNCCTTGTGTLRLRPYPGAQPPPPTHHSLIPTHSPTHPPHTVIVCTLAAVSAMVTGVVVGVLGLAEALPQTAGAALVRVLSWACILLGVTGVPRLLGPLRSVWVCVWGSWESSVLQQQACGRCVRLRKRLGETSAPLSCNTPLLHSAPSPIHPATAPVLANGAGGTRELAAVLLSKLPAGVWKALPVR